MSVKISHKLKANKTTKLPSKFIFFDTETKQIKTHHKYIIHKLKLGWACYWKRRPDHLKDTIIWQKFTTSGEFWDFVEGHVNSKSRTLLIAHNIVFDLTVSQGFTELIERGWQLKRLYEKNHMFIAKYKKLSKSILALDNMNYFACKLEQLADQVELPKIKVNFNKCTFEELSIHCKRDVEILLKVWQEYIKWLRDNDTGTFGVTIPSQAFNTYRHRFMKTDIFIHNRHYLSKLEREGYFGGRTECFKIGSFTNNKYYDLDINSMYPSVMIKKYFPTKFINQDLNCGIGKLSIYLSKYCCMARVKINTKKPMFPIRGEKVIKPKRYNQSLFYDTEYNNLKQWIKEKGGIKPEYVKVNGKLRLREEYWGIGSYYKRKAGIPVDELASSLTYEKPELANIFRIGDFERLPGDRLLEVMKKQPDINDEFEYLEKEDPENNFYWKVAKTDSCKIGKVIFPVGQFETVLTTGELKLALKENVIEKVLSVAIYEKAKIFTDYIKFFYSQRIAAKTSGKMIYSQFFKLMMNSLYGKFGQLIGEWETIGKCDPKEVYYYTEFSSKDPKLFKCRRINGLIQRYEKKSEAFNSFPAIAAHVTGYARVKLWDLMEKAERKNVYYCDTDSIFTNSLGYKNLKSDLSETEIGKLKVEKWSRKIKLFGCKQYIFGNRKRHKGKKKYARKQSDGGYSQSQWSTLKSLIQNKNLNEYRVSKVIKHFTGQYDKGQPLDNGEVLPWVL